MLAEYKVPVCDRILTLEGRASPRILESLPSPFGGPHTPSDVIFFSSFAYADLPVGKRFDTVFSRARPEQMESTSCHLVAVTQQFAILDDKIPHGWKTICMFRFDVTVPELVVALPEVEAWYEGAYDDRLGLATRETWNAILPID